MFEAEVEMERRSSGIVPLLLILALAVVVIGGVAYFVFQPKQELTAEQAQELVLATLKAQRPATVHFHVGSVTASVDEKPRDPHYRLLQKAGYVKTSPKGWAGTNVALTKPGEQKLAAMAGVVTSKEPDGTVSYTVPLAERKLVGIERVTMTNPRTAVVEYTWKWQCTELGHQFDAAGPNVKSFNTWDRATLIDKYGAAFYHAEPAKAVLAFAHGKQGWKIATE